MHRVLEFNQSQCLKHYVESNTKKRIKAEKNGDTQNIWQRFSHDT